MGDEARPLLHCQALEVGYRESILPPIDATIRGGELWVVLGRNGSGKTTWFRTLLGLVPPVRGKVEKASADLRFTYVPQRSVYDDLYPLLARDVVAMGVERGFSFFLPRFGEPPAVERALVEANASDLGDVPFRQLSEGQKQRILIARLAASNPELALLDEPTAAMDVVAERAAFEQLDALRRRYGTTVLVVSHYLGLAREFADRALFFERDSQTVVQGTPDEVFHHPAFQRKFGLAGEATVGE